MKTPYFSHMDNVLHKVFFLLFVLQSAFGFAQENTVGVISIAENVQEGYTLFAPNSNKSTYLIDNCGNLVNEWVSQKNPGLAAYLMPNGDLVRTRRESNNVFFAGGVGGGIEIFDWMGNLKWEFVFSDQNNVLHHDIAVLPNGNILAIAFELVSREEVIALGRKLDNAPASGLWADKIIEVKPLPNNEFEIVWEWRAIDHVVQNIDASFPSFSAIDEAPGRLNINYIGSGQGGNTNSDWMHSNAIDYNPELDQIILNSRNFNEFFIIDHTTTTEEASSSEGGRYGKGGDFLYRWGNPLAYQSGTMFEQRLFSQHDAHWVDAGLKDEGKIFVFNNGINRPGGSISSVDLISPPILPDGTYEKVQGEAYGPLEAEWVYGLEAEHEDITSARISGVDRLPNGNTIITVGSNGRIVELDDNIQLVWDYIVPLAGTEPIEQGETTTQNSIFRSYKYAADYPAFTTNDIEVGSPLELNPNNQFCDALPTEQASIHSNPLELINTLVVSELIVNAAGNNKVAVIDINGHVHYTFDLYEGVHHLNVDNLPNGMFYLHLITANSSILQPLRFLKMN